MRLSLAVVAALLLAACASMGRPEGGPRDVEPPVYLGSNPAPGALNVDKNKITIHFNENVQVKDVMSKVVVSPAQITPPLINALGKKIVVELRDTLQPNTTYTLDFSDAISDLNEGNEIDGFSFDFSTGPHIDTLQISGMVFKADNLEPAQGMLVGVYSNLSDTAVRTLPMERITKTNQLGEFTVRNLKEGTYRIFALTDNNRDYHWDRSEDIAFMNVTLTPTVSSAVVADTLEAADGSDSIVSRMAPVYAPSDVLLTWFNENYKPQYLVKNERPERHRITLQMNAPSDTFPELTVVGGPLAGTRIDRTAILNSSATRDTLEYWLTDSALIRQDSLLVAARYLRTDTLDNLSWTDDTLRLFIRGQKKKAREDKKKKEKTDTVPELVFMSFRTRTNGSLEVYQQLEYTASQPVASIDSSGVRLEYMDDTVWVEIEPPVFVRTDSLRPMNFRADYDWEPGLKYRLTVDSAAVKGVYDQWNKTVKTEFVVRPLDDYSSLDFSISGIDGPAVVQLLNSNDVPVTSEPVRDGHAVFMHLLPNTYYARLFVDSNGNGKYDDGSFSLNLQPEEVYYFPKKIPVKKKWNIEQTWNVTELPLDQQKPQEIKKNKPKPKAGEMPEDTPDDEEGDEFGDFYNPGNFNTNRNNGSTNSRRGNSGLRRNNGGGRFAM